MLIDLNNFLHSLAKFIVAQAAAQTPAVAIAYSLTPTSGSPNGIFRHEAVEAVAADPYSVLRVYGGPPQRYDPMPRYSLQIETVGTGNDAASSRAQTVFEAFLTSQYLPLQMQPIAAYSAVDGTSIGTITLASAAAIQRPGLISRDDRGRAHWIQNFEVEWSFAS